MVDLASISLLHYQGVRPSQEIIIRLFQHCLKFKDIAAGRQVHSLLISSNMDALPVLLDHLIRLFSFCGNLLEAALTFSKASELSIYTWQAIIIAHAVNGEDEKTIKLFFQMQDDRLDPSQLIYRLVLKACGSTNMLMQGRMIHDQVIRNELHSASLIANSLVDMYARGASLQEAQRVFDHVQGADAASWSYMIAGYAQYGFGPLAIDLFEKMQQVGVEPNKISFLCALKACGSIQALDRGKLIHKQLKGTALEADAVVGNALIDMYAKCGQMEEAHSVFDGLSHHTEESWNLLIGGYTSDGNITSAVEIFHEMQKVGSPPGAFAFTCILNAYVKMGALDKGQLIHGQVINMGLESNLFICNSLITIYSKGGSLKEAQYIFDALPERDTISWSSIISGYSQHGHGLVALHLFDRMQLLNVVPDCVTLSCILKACGIVGNLELGNLVHDHLISHQFESDLIIGNTLIDMYTRCRSLDDAMKVFDKLQSPNIVSSGAILATFAEDGEGKHAFDFLGKMQSKGIKPDNVAFSCVLRACGSENLIEYGRLIHTQVARIGLPFDLTIGNSLIDMYTKCNCIEDAHKVFDGLPNRDLVSWNLMIVVLAQLSHDLMVFELFEKMQKTGIDPNEVTLLSVLKTCGNVGANGQVNLMHHQIIDAGYDLNGIIANTLVDVYAKCGNVRDARVVFDHLLDRNIVSWGAIIAGHAQQGDCENATQCLKDMQQEGLEPNAAILSAMLSACTHAGLVEEGHRYFTLMKEDSCITPAVEHYNSIIDLYARTGFLSAAKRVLDTMPVAPDITGWISLLVASRMYNDAGIGRQCFNEIVKLDPEFSSGYILMSGIYEDSNRWGDANKLKEMRKCGSSYKKPGAAWVEIDNKVHEFIVGDKTHPDIGNMESFSRRLWRSLSGKGYVAHVDSAMFFSEHCLLAGGYDEDPQDRPAPGCHLLEGEYCEELLRIS